MVRLQSTSGNAKGDGFIHKSKENSNGTFSVGKTWKLSELRAVEVVSVSYVQFIVLLRADSNAVLDIQYYPSEDVQVADRGIE
jgi:Exocyst complex component SEC3 N-terminal PIP2 binding PH